MSPSRNDHNEHRQGDATPVVTESPVNARQGVLGRPVLIVLIGGLFLVIVAWGISEMYGDALDPQDEAPIQTNTGGSNAEVTPRDQRVIDNTEPSGERMEPVPTDRDPTPQSGTGG